MLSTNQRTSRSRYSSPMHQSSSPGDGNRGNSTDGQRSFMKRWLEPPVQSKPSFQDAGLVRHGVLENMAPLGTLPKAAMLKKPSVATEAYIGQPVKKIILKKSSPMTPARSTSNSPDLKPSELDLEPEIVPEPEAESELSLPIILSVPIAAADDENDEDYMPKAKDRKKSTRGSRQRATRKSAGRKETTPPTPTTTTPGNPPLTPVFQPPLTDEMRVPEDKEIIEHVLEVAVEEALSHHRYSTAWALRMLYDEYHEDPRFLVLMEDIFYQRADKATHQEFTRLFEEKKREGSVNNKALIYFDPSTTKSSHKPKPQSAPYSHLLKMALRVTSPHAVSEGDADEHVDKKIKLKNGPDPLTAGGSTQVNGFNRVGPSSPGQRRMRRSDSVSSISSLSSLDEEIPDDQDLEEFMEQVDDKLGVSRLSAEPNNAHTLEDPPRPIKPRQKKAAPKKNAAALRTQHHPPSSNTSADHNMPAATSSTSTATTTTWTSAVGGIKLSSKFANQITEERPYWAQRQAKRFLTKDLTEAARGDSFIRGEGKASELGPEPKAEPQSAELAPPRPSRLSALNPREARGIKRGHDETAVPVSPTALSTQENPEPQSTRNSRAATPSNLRSAAKKPKSGLRVKTSPMKKKGTSAGVPKGSGDRPSPIGNGPLNNQDENDDSCYSCGGNGELVCCEGCSYAFHFQCIDPPMDQDSLPEEWFCNECLARFTPASFPDYQGVFASLHKNLDQKNPRAFRLPEDVREAFEGVRTGPEGEYEDIPPPKQKAGKKGYDEATDYYPVRNAEGELVLCFKCHKGAENGTRIIIPCSVCKLNWHLDCVDSPFGPLSQPPILRTWVCPCHVGHMLSTTTGRQFRKLKNVPTITHAYSRGMRNNGWIEVENEDSDNDLPQQKDQDFGRITRVPEKGIKLDFISRVKEDRRQRCTSQTPSTTQIDSARSIKEQQAALTLAQLAGGKDDSKINALYQAALREASPTVLDLLAEGDASRIASGRISAADKQSLLTLFAFLDSMRNKIKDLVDQNQEIADSEGSEEETIVENSRLSSAATTREEIPDDLKQTDIKADRETEMQLD